MMTPGLILPLSALGLAAASAAEDPCSFGWPRVNGRMAALKKASAFYPHDSGPAAPDCAWVKAEGETCVVEVGPIFKRDEEKRRHDLDLRLNH